MNTFMLSLSFWHDVLLIALVRGCNKVAAPKVYVMSYVHELEVIIEAVNCITLHINYGLNKESNSNSNA